MWHDRAAARHCDQAWGIHDEIAHRVRLGELCAGLLRPGDNILDVGCGTGLVYQQLVPVLVPDDRYTGVDVAEPMLEIARERFPKGDFRLGDGYALDFPARSFSLAVCFEVLGHLPEIRPVLSEMLRVARRAVAFTVWPAERGVAEGAPDALGALQRNFSDGFVRAEIAAAAAGKPKVTVGPVGGSVVAYIVQKKVSR